MSILRVTVVGTIDTSIVENVLHFRDLNGAMTPQQVATEMINNWIIPVKNLQNVNLVHTVILVKTLTPVESTTAEISAGGITGELAGEYYSPTVTPVVKVRTATPGRKGHGRFFIFGLHGASVVNGQWHPGAFTLWNNAMLARAARFKDGGPGPLTLGVFPRSGEREFKPMVDLVLRNTLGNQRKRQRGKGI